ncbi:MAG: methyltransferase domain-containing protein [Alphaproteobacteria bacterium]|nr:methyltransferase domain-containing protein [Alphaproteobacteria bacterium]
MPVWDPNQYLKFADHRLRPALDLLARVPLETPETIVDLGCGAGNVTRHLAARWPGARIVGLDGSPEMLAKARAAMPEASWVEGDIARWEPPAPVDLIYSNAALHWLGDHGGLFPRLMGWLTPGGVLAVQMPRNYEAPSHTHLLDAAGSGPWRATLAPLLRPSPVAAPAAYHRFLASLASRLDIWETVYMQVLEGENPVAEFTKGTALKPLLDALQEPERSAFEAEYRRRIAAAYTPEADGRTLFPFRRLFIVAVR